MNVTSGFWASLALVLGVACGGDASGTGGTNGSGGAGGSAGTSGAGGNGGVLPPECVVDATGSQPYAVAFDIENVGTGEVFVLQECALLQRVLSCADGYAEPVATAATCTADCEEGGCVQCGACQSLGMPIAPGGKLEHAWPGFEYTFGQTSQGCTCHEEHAARAGKYRFELPLFRSAEDAQSGRPWKTASVDFELPSPNGVVLLEIGP